MGFIGTGKGEIGNEAESVAFLPESRLAFVLSQEEEFPACESPPLPAGNPFCLTHSHPDASAKEERCYKERL